jgi:hypothetical protein
LTLHYNAVISRRLVRKDPEHYQRFFPDVPPDLDYVWPGRSPAVLEREQRKADSAKRRNERAAKKWQE